MEKEKRPQDSSLKAIDILEVLKSAGHNGMGITAIAEAAGLNKSTVHRIILALTKRDYAIRNDETKKYKLGFKMSQFGGALLDSLDVRTIANPYLVELGRTVGETIHLVQLDGNQGVYIDKIDSPHSVGLQSFIGKRVMLHCNASGKVMLAYMDITKREQILNEAGMPRRTPRTITERDALEEELHTIKELGYAWNKSEDRDDVVSIAAPVLDSKHNLVCAVAVAGPKYRFTEDIASKAIPSLLKTTTLISGEMGHTFN